ncbi:hypothetical protein [Gluconacetobacter sacchari]|nr:hypothetical protein [Gluconacetobacter sacchari]
MIESGNDLLRPEKRGIGDTTIAACRQRGFRADMNVRRGINASPFHSMAPVATPLGPPNPVKLIHARCLPVCRWGLLATAGLDRRVGAIIRRLR